MKRITACMSLVPSTHEITGDRFQGLCKEIKVLRPVGPDKRAGQAKRCALFLVARQQSVAQAPWIEIHDLERRPQFAQAKLWVNTAINSQKRFQPITVGEY